MDWERSVWLVGLIMTAGNDKTQRRLLDHDDFRKGARHRDDGDHFMCHRVILFWLLVAGGEQYGDLDPCNCAAC